MGELILVGGGMRSGKSHFALELAESTSTSRAFLATARVTDNEMRDRIQRHQAERGDRFRNVECPLELAEALRDAPETVVLIDCLTIWLSNLLELELDNSAILLRVDALIAAAQARSGSTIIVSNEVGMGLVSLSEIGRRFQDLTGWAHQRITSAAAQVYVAILGMILRVRPAPVAVVEPSRGRT